MYATARRSTVKKKNVMLPSAVLRLIATYLPTIPANASEIERIKSDVTATKWFEYATSAIKNIPNGKKTSPYVLRSSRCIDLSSLLLVARIKKAIKKTSTVRYSWYVRKNRTGMATSADAIWAIFLVSHDSRPKRLCKNSRPK